jgi:hypothetical protein
MAETAALVRRFCAATPLATWPLCGPCWRLMSVGGNPPLATTWAWCWGRMRCWE